MRSAPSFEDPFDRPHGGSGLFYSDRGRVGVGPRAAADAGFADVVATTALPPAWRLVWPLPRPAPSAHRPREQSTPSAPRPGPGRAIWCLDTSPRRIVRSSASSTARFWTFVGRRERCEIGVAERKLAGTAENPQSGGGCDDIASRRVLSERWALSGDGPCMADGPDAPGCGLCRLSLATGRTLPLMWGWNATSRRAGFLMGEPDRLQRRPGDVWTDLPVGKASGGITWAGGRRRWSAKTIMPASSLARASVGGSRPKGRRRMERQRIENAPKADAPQRRAGDAWDDPLKQYENKMTEKP